MRDRMTKYKFFGIWEYDDEIAYLNQLSEKGWQFKKKKGFRLFLERNEEIRYIYYLNLVSTLEDKEKQIADMKEQGWEFIDFFNGWMYYRKPYVAEMAKNERESVLDNEVLMMCMNRAAQSTRQMAVLGSIISIAMTALLLSCGVEAVIIFAMLLAYYMTMVCWGVTCNIKRKMLGKKLLPFKYSMVVIGLMGAVLLLVVFLLSLVF